MPPRKKPERVTLTNPDTGESTAWLMHDEGEDDPKAGGKSSPTRFSSPYATVFAAGLLLLARDRRIRGTEHRVLAAVLATAPLAEVDFPVRLDRIGAACLLSDQEVSRSLSRLEQVGLIARPRHGWMSLNPQYVWRGGAKARETALREKIASADGAEGAEMAHRMIGTEDQVDA